MSSMKKSYWECWNLPTGNLVGVCSTPGIATAMRGYVVDMEDCQEDLVQIKEEFVDHPLVDVACEAQEGTDGCRIGLSSDNIIWRKK